MLNLEDNTLLTRVGPGTPMGGLMRQYWLPALLSSELPAPDAPPLRLRLLGEDLVAFRSTSGQVGLLDHRCPHRGASLFFARNEEGGLRCVYHGWKFDVQGRCLDMPSEPPESSFKDKVRATAYPCRERGGIVWAYMGQRTEPPPLPDLEPNMQPEGGSSVWAALRECNWAQALEGDIDTAHLAFLHLGGASPDDLLPGSFDYYTVRDRAPRHQVADTECGTMYGAYRPAEEDTYYWRFAQFLFPFYTMIPTGLLGAQVMARAWVPLDDHHTMFWSISGPNRSGFGAGPRPTRSGRPVRGTDGPIDYQTRGTGWLARWRLATARDNDYLMDRGVQRAESYTGIDGIQQQDQAITESMGSIVDRSREHLGASDAMVIRTRQRIIRAVRDQLEGTTPPGVDSPELCRVRSGGVLLPRTADWLEATESLRQAFVDHPELAAG